MSARKAVTPPAGASSRRERSRARRCGSVRWTTVTMRVTMCAPAGRSSRGTSGSAAVEMPGGREAKLAAEERLV